MIIPYLRQDLEIFRGNSREDGAPAWLLYDAVRNKYFTLGLTAFKLIKNWSGGDDIQNFEKKINKSGIDTTVDEITSFIGFLQQNNLIIQPPGQNISYLLQQKNSMKKGWLMNLIHSYLFFKIPLFKPDEWLGRNLNKVKSLGSSKFRKLILSLFISLSLIPATFLSANALTFTMATSGSETDMRSVAIVDVFQPAVSGFADMQIGYNATMFDQGTELDAISRGNLTMSIASAQELAQFFPEFSIFATGYVHQDAAHQVRVFNDPLMDPFKKKAEDELGVKLLSVMYLGKRHVNLRQTKDELTVNTPADLAGVNLRMPGTDAWQFLGNALGASATPLAFNEVYQALATGAVDGQDNPLPTVVDKKFYEVTKQIALTSHLVDLNYIAFSKETWDSLSPEQQMTVQRAADAAAAYGRLKQLDKENNLADFIRSQGVEIYTPDLEAFRTHVQKQYEGSEVAATWPEGVLDKINSLGN